MQRVRDREVEKNGVIMEMLSESGMTNDWSNHGHIPVSSYTDTHTHTATHIHTYPNTFAYGRHVLINRYEWVVCGR